MLAGKAPNELCPFLDTVCGPERVNAGNLGEFSSSIIMRLEFVVLILDENKNKAINMFQKIYQTICFSP